MSRRSRPRLGNVINLAGGQNRTWYSIVDATDEQPDVTELYIHDEIGGWGVYSTDLIRELMGVTTPRIKVNINSPGGDVFEGFAIHNALMSHPATIETYTGGLAASAASVIFQAGEKRIMGEYATQMIHNPSAGVWGESKDMRQMADLLDKLRDTIAQVYVDRSGQSVDDVVAMMADETWFNASEAKDFGLVDEIDTAGRPGAAMVEPNNSWNLKNLYRFSSREEAGPPKSRNRVRPTIPVIRPKDLGETPGGRVALGEFTVDPDVFKAAMRIAADPPVPTTEAPFQWDPDVFKAVLADKANHAPAVAVDKAAEPEARFEDQFDGTLLRQAVIEGVSRR